LASTQSEENEEDTPMSNFSIVIPSLNEQDNLHVLLPEVRLVLREIDAQIEVVVVIGCNDDPNSYPQDLGAGYRYVRRDPSDSFGDAIRAGIASSDPSSEFIIFMDADGSHSPRSLVKLISAPKQEDVVVASRYTQGGSTENSYLLRFMSRALNFAYRIVLGIPCNDISTNFKRYRRADLVQLDLTCNNFDIVEEIVFRVKSLRGKDFSILELPDHFAERRHGVSKRQLGPYIVSYLLTLVTLRRKVAHGKEVNVSRKGVASSSDQST